MANRLSERLARLEAAAVPPRAREDVDKGNFAEEISAGLRIVGFPREENDSVAEHLTRFIGITGRQLADHFKAMGDGGTITTNGFDSESVRILVGGVRSVGIHGITGIHGGSGVESGCMCTWCEQVRILRHHAHSRQNNELTQ